ncbi:MAG: transaldolase [Nitrospiraceae bacterium]|nr:transaldolase [Nitrospiraceae bacterium]
MHIHLPDALDTAVHMSLDSWNANKKVQKLWAKDASLWTGTNEANWLGWLNIATDQLEHIETLEQAGHAIAQAGFTHILLLGMGGSSLCPEVFTRTFSTKAGAPILHMLDSTDPSQVAAVEATIDLPRTKVIVSSKSGTTLEPTILKQYFFNRIKQVVEPNTVGTHFIAITDPGSRMEAVAKRDKFDVIFHGIPSIGGRYSALSNFGIVPAAGMGMNIRKLLTHAKNMSKQCGATVAPEHNPGVMLGTVIGMCANEGRDKLTIVTSPALRAFGGWLEQLLAESTGKEGKGIIPVDLEQCGPPNVYGNDRLFVYITLAGEKNSRQDARINELQDAGHPSVHIPLADRYELGAEMFRWEMATAVAGTILGINPFNQPDVEASKIATHVLTTEYENTGSLPPETPLLEESGIRIFIDTHNAKSLGDIAGNDKTLLGYLKAHLNTLKVGDYFALLAYIHMNETHHVLLDTIRHRVRDTKKVATCLEYGPRFLHSTGQLYKGGPNSGVFVQITCDDATDLKVPDQAYTFGIVKSAQARGDFQVLSERGRRVLRLHLGTNVPAGLAVLKQTIEEALHIGHKTYPLQTRRNPQP